MQCKDVIFQSFAFKLVTTRIHARRYHTPDLEMSGMALYRNLRCPDMPLSRAEAPMAIPARTFFADVPFAILIALRKLPFPLCMRDIQRKGIRSICKDLRITGSGNDLFLVRGR